MDKQYCNNCGNYGHLYKNCRHPILSYGIILYFKHQDTNEIKIVMIERKDSLSYIEFLRGKYNSIYNIKYLKLLFSRMSKEEIDRINKYSFDTLWNKLWIHTETINFRIKKEYTKSKTNFNTIKKGYYCSNELINFEYLTNHLSKYITNEWEIPKGRRNKYETNKECAIREFKEETNINNSSFEIINNMIPLVEEYEGINKVKYKHIYYIAQSKEEYNLKINMENKDQYTEIKNISWLNEKEAYNIIRDYDINKKNVLSKFFGFMKNYNTYVTLEK